MILSFIMFIFTILSSFTLGITNTIYVEAFHIMVSENQYTTTFLCISSNAIAGKEGENEIATTKSENLYETFWMLENSVEQNIDFNHISSVILDQSMINPSNLEEFNEMIKNSDYFNFSFYIFTSFAKAEELFSLKNPDESSAYFSILDVSQSNEYLFDFCRPLHFTKMVSSLYSKYPSIEIPSLAPVNYWAETGIALDGVLLYDGMKRVEVKKEKDPNFCLINSNEIIELEGTTVLDYKVKIKKKKNSLKITLKGTVIKKKKNLNFGELFKNELLKYENSFDLLNLKSINYKFNKFYNINSIVIQSEIKEKI